MSGLSRESLEAMRLAGETPFETARKNASFLHKRYRVSRECTILGVSRAKGEVTFMREAKRYSAVTVSAEQFNKIVDEWIDSPSIRHRRGMENYRKIEAVLDEAYAEHDKFLVREAVASGDVEALAKMVTDLNERLIQAEKDLEQANYEIAGLEGLSAFADGY